MINNLFYIDGSYRLRKDIKKDIFSSLKDIGDYEHIILDKIKFEEFTTKFFSNDIFDNNKIFTIKELPIVANKNDLNKKWLSFFENIDRSKNVVIFDNIGLSKASVILKAINKIGKSYIFPEYGTKSELLSFFRKYLTEKGKTMSKEDIDLIIEFIGKEEKGYNIDSYYNFLEKSLILQNSPNKKEISKDTIIQLLPIVKNRSIWDYYSFLKNKDINSSISFVSSINDKDFPKNFEYILNILSWKFNMLLLLKDMNLSGKSNNQIIEELKDFKKEDKQIYSEYTLRGCLEGSYGEKPDIDSFTRGELINISKFIDKSIIKLRWGCSFKESKINLDMLSFMVCGFLSYKDIANL